MYTPSQKRCYVSSRISLEETCPRRYAGSGGTRSSGGEQICVDAMISPGLSYFTVRQNGRGRKGWSSLFSFFCTHEMLAWTCAFCGIGWSLVDSEFVFTFKYFWTWDIHSPIHLQRPG